MSTPAAEDLDPGLGRMITKAPLRSWGGALSIQIIGKRISGSAIRNLR